MSAMICPTCHSRQVSVIDSRAVKHAGLIRRRRVCLTCKGRFTTYEGINKNEGNANMDRRSRMLEEDSAKSANGPGMIYYAVKSFTAGGYDYHPACLTPPEDIPNFNRLVEQGFIRGFVPGTAPPSYGKPQRVKKKISSEPRVPVQIKWADGETDKVRRFEKTFDDTVAGIIATGSDNGDIEIAKSRALDAIENDRPKGELWTRQFRTEDAERQSRQKNKPMRREVRAY